MQDTAEQAKSRFGAICRTTKTAPVFAEKDDRVDTVILSAQHLLICRQDAATSICRNAASDSINPSAPGWLKNADALKSMGCGAPRCLYGKNAEIHLSADNEDEVH